MQFDKEVEHVAVEIERATTRLAYPMETIRNIVRNAIEYGYQKGRKSVIQEHAKAYKVVSAKEAGFHE